MRTRVPSALLAVAFFGLNFTSAAYAAARDRVFVASYGNDSNPCSFTQPCRTFQAAVNAVAAGGEVTAIDSAGFGPISINKAVTITSPPGVEAGIVPGGGDAIDIVAGSGDVVALRGLTLDGGNGTFPNGVSFASGSSLVMTDCVVRGFQHMGVTVGVTALTTVTIQNTLITRNDVGIDLVDQGGSTGNLIATLDHVTFESNTTGASLIAVGGNADALIANSAFAHNGVGLNIGAQLAPFAVAVLQNVNAIDNSKLIDLGSSHTAVSLSHVTDVSIFQNGPGTSVSFDGSSAGAAFSDGTNHVTLGGPNNPGSLGAYPTN